MIASLIKKYGWKTICGSILLALGQIMGSVPSVAEYASVANALGFALGGIGIRVAMSKPREAKPDA